MKHVRVIALVAMGLGVSGCASLDVPSRNAPFEAPQAAAVAPSMKVEAYQVRVPKTLKASEANLFYPSGDIVWRGDKMGDRHAQVKKIFEDSLARGTAGADGAVPVVLDVEVKRFHALTEKARYTTGGRHEIKFTLRFLDPETLQPVAEPREIDATFKAFGGQRAIAAERNGVTQRYRISNQLTAVIQRELGIGAKPEDTAAAKPIAVKPDEVSRNAAPLLLGDKTAGLF